MTEAIETSGVVEVAEAKHERVSRDAFIKAWYGCNSVKEVAAKLGLTPNTVGTRASKIRTGELNEDGTYRTMPFPLKKFPQGGGVRLNPETTFAMLAELTGKTIEQVKAESEKMAATATAKRAEKAAG